MASSNRKHPSAAFWATVVVVVALVAYPLSYGPWIGYREYAPQWMLDNTHAAFSPIQKLCDARIAPEFYRRYLNHWSGVARRRQLDQIAREMPSR
jgi:hypothetical protein